MHLGRESAVRLPLARGEGGSLFKHLVDLLERKALGLRNEEERKQEGDAAQPTPHEEDVGAERVDEVRGDESDDAVPEPVGRGGQTDAARSDG